MGDATGSFSLIAWAMLACLVGRAVNVYPLSMAVNCCSKVKVNSRERHVVSFAGLRGAVAFMCAIDFPEGPQGNGKRSLVLFTTIIITGASILVLGWPTGFVLKRLGVTECSSENANVEERSAGHPVSCLQRLDYGLKRMLMTQEAWQQRDSACESIERGDSRTLSHPRVTLADVASCNPEALLSALGVAKVSQNEKTEDGLSSVQASEQASVSLSVHSAPVFAAIRVHSLPVVTAPLPPIESGRPCDPPAPTFLPSARPSSRSARMMCDP